MRIFFTAALCAFCIFSSRTGWAEASPYDAQIQMLAAQVEQLTRTVQDLKITLDSQRREIDSLRAASESVPAKTSVTPSVMRMMPEIGVVADTALKLDSPKEDGEGADRLSVREIELVLGGAVDPWTRLDSTLAFTEEEGVELEEAYATRYGLPLDLTARIGRLKPRIGKALPVHRDSLDTVDEPLVIQRYFGVEGMAKTGADLKRSIDLPWPVVHEATVGILEGGNGEDGTLFGETKRRPTIYARLKNYLDLTDATNLEVGLNHMAGSRDADSEFEVMVLGLDGTLIHHLSPSQSIKLQGEAYQVNRAESVLETVVDESTGETVFDDLDGNIWGGYALLDLRFHSQWAAGFRYDQVEIVDRPVDSSEHHDRGYTGYLTFHQSEFARWRAQFSHFDLTDGSDDNQVLLQGTFAIGEHKHKIQ